MVQWQLTDEGREVVREGSHEARLYNAVDSRQGTLQAQLMVCDHVILHIVTCCLSITHCWSHDISVEQRQLQYDPVY